jgi:peptidoglycan/LPS O-acetylase OafA/YrhL
MISGGDRFPALDGLRAVAILQVILNNTDTYTGESWLLPLSLVAHSGWTGVQLFFVLSGFLITRQLLITRGLSGYFSSFYARRALRIFPLYFLALILLLLLAPLALDIPARILDTYDQQKWLWLFLNNWSQPFHGAVYWFPHFWSLAIEEQFYLLWPLVIAFVPRRLLPATFIALVCIALVSRCIAVATDASPDVVYMFTICRMDALVLGAAAALIQQDAAAMQWIRRSPNTIFGLGLALLLVVGMLTGLYDKTRSSTMIGGYLALGLGFSVLVLLSSDEQCVGLPQRLRKILSGRIATSIARYSYAMYVVHLPIELAFGRWIDVALRSLGPAAAPVHSLAIFALAYVAAAISYFTFEKWFLALKVYFRVRCDATHTTQRTG